MVLVSVITLPVCLVRSVSRTERTCVFALIHVLPCQIFKYTAVSLDGFMKDPQLMGIHLISRYFLTE